jgi:hypothetical protein
VARQVEAFAQKISPLPKSGMRMKIVRLKKNYRINCSDSEYAILNRCVEATFAAISDEILGALQPAEKTALSRMLAQGRSLVIDEDRR